VFALCSGLLEVNANEGGALKDKQI
jgi:hypothetical protein